MNVDADAVDGDEEDDDLDLDLDDDEPLDDDPEPEAEATDEPAGKKGDPKPDASAEATAATAAALNAVKAAWAEGAKAKFPLADFDGLGITGLDAEAKAAFEKQAEASHVAKVEEFKALGLVYDPAAAGRNSDDIRDAALAAAWGVPVVGTAGPTADQKVMEAVEAEAAAGNVDGTIRTLLGAGKMGEFFFKGKR